MTACRGRDPARAGRRGFTLIEMSLVAALIGVVGLAVYQSLSSGLRIWERTQLFRNDEDTAMLLDRLERDLRNSFPYTLLPFEGKDDRVAFATMLRVPADPKSGRAGSYVDQIGRADYYFDAKHQAVFLRQADYSQALENTFGPPRQLAGDVAAMRLSYILTTPEGEEELRSAAKEEYPRGVLIELQIREGGGTRAVTRLVSLPLGGGG